MNPTMRSRPGVESGAAASDQVATGALAVSVPEEEALRASVTELMRPPAPAKVRQLRVPTVTGRVLLDLRVREATRWGASEEAHRLTRAFWCPSGAAVLLLVAPGLAALSYIIEPIIRCEPGSIDVLSDTGTVRCWVQALRTPQGVAV